MSLTKIRWSNFARVLATFAAFLGIALLTTRARAAELIVNGNFETGDFTGWTHTGTGAAGSCDFNYTVVNGAVSSCFIGGGNSTFYAVHEFQSFTSPTEVLSQTVVVPAGLSSAALSWRDAVQTFPIGGTIPSFQWDLYASDGTTLIANLYLATYPGFSGQPWTSHSTDVLATLSAHAGETVILRATNVNGRPFPFPSGFGIDDISLTYAAGATIAPATPSAAPLGQVAFTATGGAGAPYTWSLATNASGGGIDATTGVYTAGATPSVTDVVRVTDSSSAPSTVNVVVGPGVTISPPSPVTAPLGTIGLMASGGSDTGFVWSFLSNNSGGSIDTSTGSYTAGATGGITDSVHVVDSLGNAATINIAVGAGVSINPASPTTAPQGSISFTATGGNGSFTFSFGANNSGGSLSPTGAYTAGPTGSVSDVINVTDSLGNSSTTTVSVGPGLTITPFTASAPPQGSVNFSITGGSGTGYGWSVSANNSGASIGTTTGAYVAGTGGSVTDTVTVTDSLGNIAMVTIAVGPQIAITPSIPTVPPRGSVSFGATGGNSGPYIWSFGINASGGTIDSLTGSYTAGAAANSIDVIIATDGLGNTAATPILVGAGVSILPASPATPPLGNVALTATGGSGTGFTWAVTTNNSTSIIDNSGSYTAGPTGNTADIVTVTDSLGNTATVSISVGSGLSINPNHISQPPLGSASFTATGGSGVGYVFTLDPNNSGGSISADGNYTAGAIGSVTDTIRATDSLGNTTTTTADVGPGLTILSASATVPPLGTMVFTVSGGSGSGFVWSLATNASNGSITPSGGLYMAGTTGSVNDVIHVSDSLGNVATANMAVSAAVAIAPAAPTVPPHGAQHFTATGGTGLYVFSLQTNASGATLDSASGSYTAGIVAAVTDVVAVTDSNGGVSTTNVTVGADISISPSNGVAGPNQPIAFTAMGGSGVGYSWGYPINASHGTINPTTGAYVAGPTTNVTDLIRVTDSLGNLGHLAIAIGSGVAINPALPSAPPLGAIAFVATGGTGTGYAWTLVTNASGGSIDAATGAYTAGTNGNVSDIVRVSDSVNNSANVTITVRGGLSISPSSPQINAGGSLTFSVAGGSGSGYLWSLGTNATGATIDSASGAYTAGNAGGADVVHVVDSLGNVADDSVSVRPPVVIVDAGPDVREAGRDVNTVDARPDSGPDASVEGGGGNTRDAGADALPDVVVVIVIDTGTPPTVDAGSDRAVVVDAALDTAHVADASPDTTNVPDAAPDTGAQPPTMDAMVTRDAVADARADAARAADTGTTEDDSGATENPPSDSGCSCRVAGSENSNNPWGTAAAALLGLVAIGRRKRRASRRDEKRA
jgi:MYXO-CTERM domain-containing protein